MLKNISVNRLLILGLHIVGWASYLTLPFLFMRPRGIPREELRMFRPGGGLSGGSGNGDWPVRPPGNLDFSMLRLEFFALNLVLILFFYLNIYVLVPRILTRKSWGHYLMAIAGCLGLVILSSELINLILVSEGSRGVRPYYFTFVNFLLVFALSTALRLTSDRVKFDRERKERETESLKSELSLLRSQVSPHFMFNVLNNLASLARKKSSRLEPVIIQLSHLMRYMLYDSGEKKVTVEKEMLYLRSYIDLQKLRFGEEVAIRFDAEVTGGDLPMEPMLLIPFVENAFKHGVGVIGSPAIEITLSIRDHALDFRVKNRFNKGGRDEKDPGSGIGIQNVQRRLELLYRDLHQLSITTEESWFMVQLNVILR